MLKKSSRRNNAPRAANPRRYRWMVLVVLALSILGTTMLAQVNSRKKATPAAEVSVMSLSATTPAKEYIYAGSKLVATEEAIAFADSGITSNPYYSDILKIARRKVTVGCGVNAQGQPLYCPNDSVTREQMAAFITRALGEFSPPTPPSQHFNDVPPANIFYNFIDRMAVLNITLGCDSAPNYCPTLVVAHEQMATFIVRALHPPGPYNPPTPPSQRFTDVAPANVFYAFIDEYAARGIWRGCDDVPGAYFCPSGAVTRAQMAHILVQAFGTNWQ